MAVEIKELVIKAVIADEENLMELPGVGNGGSDNQQIVQECVSQVLKIIRKINNR